MKDKPFSGRSPKSKKYFAAFCNMAELNLENTVRHIFAPYARALEKDSWSMCTEGKASDRVKAIAAKLPVSDQADISRLLIRHFPFLKPLCKEDTFSCLMKTLCIFIDVLGRVRNEFTHFAPEARETFDEVKVTKWLASLLTAGAREVRERFKPAVVANAKDSATKEVYVAVNDIFQSTKRFKKTEDDKGKTVYKVSEDYIYSMSTTDPNGYAMLNDMGALRLCCLFLEKKYIAQFFDGVKPYKYGMTAAQKKAVMEVFSIFGIRLAQEKFDTTLPEYALALDMLNELQRCPRELFDTFSEQGKERFRVPITSTNPDAVQDDGVMVEGGQVLLVRHKDRFPTFALRYIDQQKLFEDIRFQVSVGSWRFKFYDKQLMGDAEGITKVRVIQKDIHGFGRWDDVELARKDKYSPFFKPLTDTTVMQDEEEVTLKQYEADTADSKPYMTDHRTSYLLSDNRIGFTFNREGSDKRNVLNADGVYLPDVCDDAGTPLTGRDVKLQAPLAWLSVYELPALIFYHHLYRKHKEGKAKLPSPESILKDYVCQYYRLFADVKQGIRRPWADYAPLQEKDVPEKLVKWIKGETAGTNFEGRSRATITQMKEDTDCLLTRFKDANKIVYPKEDSKSKKDKRRHMDIRPGVLAARLMEDMLFFQPSSSGGRNKLTGANYASLQAALASKPMSRNELKALLTKAGIMAPSNGDSALYHPFLYGALNSCPENGTHDDMPCIEVRDFFDSYMREKKRYLVQLEQAPASVLRQQAFLHAERAKWQKLDDAGIKALAARYAADDRGIQLPRGLFLKPIKDILTSIGLDVYDDDNVSYLITYYFQAAYDDSCQAFYDANDDFKRTYKYFNTLYNSRNKQKQLLQSFYTVEEMEQLTCRLNNGQRPCHEREKVYLEDLQKNSPRGSSINDESQKLHRLYKEYTDNERLIRRYKVQDMMIWLMANDILLGKGYVDEAAIRENKLKEVMPRSSSKLMSLEVPFSITLTVPVSSSKGSSKSVKGSSKSVKVNISQKEKIQLKRYGEQFLFINDTRLRSLIGYLHSLNSEEPALLSIDREELETEFMRYDTARPEIAGMVHQIEQKALEQHPELLKKPDPSSPQQVKESYYLKYDESKKYNPCPKRHNFGVLLKLLSDHQDSNDYLTIIRNAFMHNSYENFKFTSELPAIAERAKDIFNETKKEMIE